jgi:glucose-1-phosphate cytidylyltransferase
MKVGILAGGFGTRLQEETGVKPKPMVEIGGRPILWHIMQGYAAYGFKEFVIALGYKGDVIKDYILNYRQRSASLTVCLASGKVEVHDAPCEDWLVHLLDTGIGTQTGGRVRRVAEFVGNESFMLAYGDGVGNIDLKCLLECHRSHGCLATLTAVRPPARFGSVRMGPSNRVARFEEKPVTDGGWINAGFFVLEPGVVDYISGDEVLWEKEPLERLAQEGQLVAYCHQGFWQCMDTLRDVRLLENLWQTGKAPWKV